jgi:hypothetical protein
MEKAEVRVMDCQDKVILITGAPCCIDFAISKNAKSKVSPFTSMGKIKRDAK